MARRINYELFCCLCGSELPFKRILEQRPNGGYLRYIELEVGFVCMRCLEKLPDAKPPVPIEKPSVVKLGEGSLGVSPRGWLTRSG